MKISLDDLTVDASKITRIYKKESEYDNVTTYFIIYFIDGHEYSRSTSNRNIRDNDYNLLVNAMKQGENKNMLQEIKSTVSDFIKENKTLITWIAVLFLADHFFFGGKFRERLHRLIEGLISKVEKKAEDVK